VDLLFQSKNNDSRQSTSSSHRSDSHAGDLGNLAEGKTYFIANQNSDVYHTTNCRWSKKIKADNILRFSSAQEAEAQNFLACTNCKPDERTYGDHLEEKNEKKNLWSYR
jgi:hypothetical protein